MNKKFIYKNIIYSILVIQNLFFFSNLLGSNNKKEIKINNSLTNKKELKINKLPNIQRELQINFENIESILLKNNLEIKKAYKGIQESNLVLDEIKSKYNIKFDLDSTIPQYSTGKVYSSENNLETSLTNNSTTLGITLPLYDPVKKPEIDASKKQIEIAKNDYEIVKKDLLLEALKRFIVLKNAHQEVDNGNKSVELSLLGLKDAEAKLENGIGNKLDLLEAKIQLNKDQKFLIDKKNNLKLANNSLKKILYLEEDIYIQIDKSQSIIGWWNYALEENIKFGLKNSLNLTNTLFRKKIKLDEAQISIGQSRPNFFIKNETSSSFSKGDSLVPEVDKDAYENSYSNSVSLNFSWDIFDGGITKNSIKKNKLQSNIEELNYKIESNLLKEEIINQHKKLKSEEMKLYVSKEELNSALEAIELSRLRLNSGVTDQREVINAQKDLTNAKSGFYSNIASYNTSLVNLSRFTGQEILNKCQQIDKDQSQNQICTVDSFSFK